MNILLMSKEGDGLGIAAKLQDEGHSVRVWLPDDRFEYALLGILERSSNWRRDAADWAGLVMSDMVGFGKHETTLNGFDTLHLGFNPIADVLELDRERQLNTLRKFGIPMPETFSFDSPAQARDLSGIWTTSVKGFVLKPSGNIDTGKTMVLRDKRFLDWALDQYSGDQALVAQRYVEGVEISTQGWFNGLGWVEPFDHTMEEKRFLTGSHGPNVGCMGNVVWPITAPDRNRFVKELKKLTPFLKAISYKGPIDLNCIADASGIWALELTVRFGYDAIEAWHALLKEPFGVALMELAMKTKQRFDLQEGYATAVRLSIPPYPHGDASKMDRGQPVVGLTGGPGQYLADVYHDRGMMRWSAADGVLAKIVGTGASVRASRRAAYAGVDRIETPGLQYRTDIGERVDQDVKQLRKWKYL